VSNDFVQVPPDGSGKKLDSERVTGGGAGGSDIVHRERMQIAGAVIAALAEVLNVDPAGSEYALLARLIETKSPKVTYVTATTIAAGSSANLDSDQIGSGLTGKLLGAVISSSVPFKATIQTVLNGVATNKVTAFSADRKWNWKTPAREFVQQAQNAGAGFDGFRAIVVNLDTSQPADLYGAFFFDEV